MGRLAPGPEIATRRQAVQVVAQVSTRQKEHLMDTLDEGLANRLVQVLAGGDYHLVLSKAAYYGRTQWFCRLSGMRRTEVCYDDSVSVAVETVLKKIESE